MMVLTQRKESANSDAELVAVDSATALSFLEEHSTSDKDRPGSNLRSWGIEGNGQLLAVIAICNPRTLELQKSYTTELYGLAVSNQKASGELINSLMSIAMESGIPDLFIQGERAKEYGQYGFERSTVSSDNSESSIYHWRDPSVRFYTYKITSSKGKGYYIGRHRTSLETIEEMVTDGYMGSGGVKYKNWIASVGEETLSKEITGVYGTWKEVVAAEEQLIGNLYKTDSNCKNSKPGGIGLTSYMPAYTIDFCPIHGKTKFRGRCHKCTVGDAQSLKECTIHGLVLHRGDSCFTCVRSKTNTKKECLVHGLAIHYGDTCSNCASAAAKQLAECEIHGFVIHQGSSCATCVAEKSVSLKICAIHGETKHVGQHCRKCLNGSVITESNCPIHGLTSFKGESCVKCSAAKSWAIFECPIHGQTKHRGNSCEKCTQQQRAAEQRALEVVQSCATHGETAFLKGECKRCVAQKKISLKKCPTHGKTKHTGNTCGKCLVAKVWTTEECSIHGLVKHRSGKCQKCAALASWAKRKAKAKVD